MEGIVGDSAKSIQSIVDRDTNFARKYGYARGLRWNAISAVEIFEPVLAYWEKRVDTDKSTLERLLDTGVLLELMNLFVHMNRDEFYSTHVSVKCKSCLGKLCTVKRDLYNAVVIKCRFVSLVCKFSVKTLLAKACAVTRKIMKRNVEWIIRETKESECKRWRQSWNTCRNLTYNVGVLSEHVYEESRRWVHIKKITPKEVASLATLDRLTSDEDEIKSELGLSIESISKYDVTALCLREVNSLLEHLVTILQPIAASCCGSMLRMKWYLNTVLFDKDFTIPTYL
ncbi:PREDICTED: uncharacterized protein LOC105570948 [Vollenhovia emeryi]|uniref:uncharacterized protein LOC105570948 n=1 Tax=Vollenhovia emeryi TaxID=411798 RepID=UPI0005F5194A|nr:PREDICTED: uncharacterized protein LOC105570948 [Vollenhovia emeryi]